MPAKKKTSKRKATRRKKTSASFPVKKWILILSLMAVCVLSVWVFYLDVQVREKFNGKKWAIPARVYAEPLTLYEGLRLSQADLVSELQAIGYEQVATAQPTAGQFYSAKQTVYLRTQGFHFWDGKTESMHLKVSFRQGVLSQLEAGDEFLVRLEPREIGSIYPQDGEDRILVNLTEIPPLLGEALIAVEDRDFARHYGVSLRGIFRAALANLKAGGVVQGGSTLTQQLVKNFYLSQERSFQRKAQELVMALILEWRYSKADILEAYINEVYLGQNGRRGIHGFGLAAQFYFNRPLEKLSVEQIALLVGVVKGASFYNPWRQSERAMERRNVVLALMHEQGLINDSTHQQSLRKPLGVVSQQSAAQSQYPAYLDLVKRQLLRDYKRQDLQSEGLKIFTPLSPRIQSLAERTVQSRLNQFEQNDADLQAGVLITKVGSGEVAAVVGDKNPRFQGFNRALDAKRPIGSLVKPFVFLTALKQPQQYAWNSVLDDSPLTIDLPNGDTWQPKNFSRENHGSPLMLEALTRSYNQSTARLGMALGVDAVIDTIEQAGFDGKLQPLPSVVLGALSMSPLEVSHLYHTLAADGVYTPLRAIYAVLDARNKPLRRYGLKSESRFTAEQSHLIHYGLQAVMQQGTGRGAYQNIPQNLMVAGKTGTTNNQRDSWFAGYSGDYLGVVWLGKDDNSPTRLTGSSGALSVWSQLMKSLPPQSVAQDTPENIVYHWVDQTSGKLSRDNCKNATLMPFVKGSEPTQQADCYQGNSGIGHWLKRIF